MIKLLWSVILLAANVNTLFPLQGQLFELDVEVSATEANLYGLLLLLADECEVMKHGLETNDGMQCTRAALSVTMMA